ncbi:hypothetical protein [Trabulsiella odontotermitis]|uniref:hypothetical protein n=1 Tax=Trabulsiella odontotermitis TaxID=379893 RepID=UPI0012D7E36F|nr:hypothetical protein [Trabulsiella odontotermitis]
MSRIASCDCLAKLELLHNLICKNIPAKDRGEFIVALNTRHDELASLSYYEKDYIDLESY